MVRKKSNKKNADTGLWYAIALARFAMAAVFFWIFFNRREFAHDVHAIAIWVCAAIGLALIFGVLVRAATVTGSVLLALVWLKTFGGSTNVLTESYLLDIVLLWIIFFGYPHQVLSIGAWWRHNVARWRWLW